MQSWLVRAVAPVDAAGVRAQANQGLRQWQSNLVLAHHTMVQAGQRLSPLSLRARCCRTLYLNLANTSPQQLHPIMCLAVRQYIVQAAVCCAAMLLSMCLSNAGFSQPQVLSLSCMPNSHGTSFGSTPTFSLCARPFDYHKE